MCHNPSFFISSNPAQRGVNPTNPYVEDENFFFLVYFLDHPFHLSLVQIFHV